MKKTLFGTLGQAVRENAVIILLGLCVAGAGALSLYTIKDINSKLESQSFANPDPLTAAEQEAQPVDRQAENIPLKPESTTEETTPKNEKAANTDKAAAPETEQTADTTATAEGFVLPVKGKICTAFSGDELVYNPTMDDWRTHNGIDISATRDTPVKAGAAGVVTNVYSDGMLGFVVETDCGSYTVRYCGLGSRVAVDKGDRVQQGDTLGVVGEIPLETAEESHIHLEFLQGGKYIDPNEILAG